MNTYPFTAMAPATHYVRPSNPSQATSPSIPRLFSWMQKEKAVEVMTTVTTKNPTLATNDVQKFLRDTIASDVNAKSPAPVARVSSPVFDSDTDADTEGASSCSSGPVTPASSFLDLSDDDDAYARAVKFVVAVEPAGSSHGIGAARAAKRVAEAAHTQAKRYRVPIGTGRPKAFRQFKYESSIDMVDTKVVEQPVPADFCVTAPLSDVLFFGDDEEESDEDEDKENVPPMRVEDPWSMRASPMSVLRW